MKPGLFDTIKHDKIEPLANGRDFWTYKNTIKSNFAPPGRFFDILGRLLDASGTLLGRIRAHFGRPGRLWDAFGVPF